MTILPQTQDENNDENENLQSLTRQNQAVSHCADAVYHRHVHLPSYYSPGSMDCSCLHDDSGRRSLLVSSILCPEKAEGLDEMLAFQLAGNQLQFLIPFFTELPDKGLFQKLINGKVLFLA